MRARGSLVVALALMSSAPLAACTDGASDLEPGSPATYQGLWAHEAVQLFDSMAGAFERQSAFDVASFFSAGGFLDLTVWGGSVTTDPDEMAAELRELWFLSDRRTRSLNLAADDVFLSVDGAVVAWRADDGRRVETWMQTYSIDGSEIGSRVLEAGRELPDEVSAAIDRSGAGHDEAWSTGDLADSESVVVVEIPGTCPTSEARRLVVREGKIIEETVYAHVRSARRCVGRPVTTGWWEGYEPPPPLDRVRSEQLQLAHRTIELVNAETGHQMFTRWMFERFPAAGLAPPDVAAVRFPPSAECDHRSGSALAHDERYEGEHTVVVCYEVAKLYLRDPHPPGWSALAVNFGLHELAHIWMLDHVGEDREQAFLERSGLTGWNPARSRWEERGVEHAASTIAWGLAGDTFARYTVIPEPSCAELTARFEVLTGRAPLTACSIDPRVRQALGDRARSLTVDH
jgi:hypothetical protein